jgi:lipopolysaccharide/colanic/teichoic acid biosynthesis glycosyltransferase
VGIYQSFGKRACDLALAALLLPPAAPLVALGALAAWLSLGRPVLFVQARLGRGGTVWQVAKLRTMRPGPEPDAARTPAVGRLLRRAKIDELPQLGDVLAGRLSFVGPRPLPPGIMPDADPLLPLRLSVRPGLTGWAQVCGGTLLSNPEKLALDCFYARRVSAGFDARILARTVRTLLAGERRDEAAIAAALADAQRGFTDAPPAAAMR